MVSHGYSRSSDRRRPRPDEEVVVDGNLTTGRSPDDLPAFCARIVEELAKAPQRAGRSV